jgi:HEPN domain-containing protein
MKSETVKKWVERVTYDMETARVMLQTGRYIYVIFLCQQSVEKCLKALLAYQDKEVIPIHNLRRLAETSGIVGELGEPSLLKLDFLSQFYINARYKEGIQELSKGITENVCADFIRFSEEMIEWLCQKMKQ